MYLGYFLYFILAGENLIHQRRCDHQASSHTEREVADQVMEKPSTVGQTMDYSALQGTNTFVPEADNVLQTPKSL